MPIEILMPRLGWDMQVGSVAEWLKHDGERVAAGETICMIAGDKATTELDAEGGGILRIPADAPEPGIEVPVGTLLAYVLGPDEHVPDARGSSLASRRIVATPRARRAAAAVGLDWRTLVGSGRGGRILERDVLRAPRASPTEPAAPLSGIRRLTAERIASSARAVVPVTLTTEADATALVQLREQAIREQPETSELPSYTDLIVKLVAMALVEHPALNAELTDTGIIEHKHVNIGIAVDTPSGLVAPVIRAAASISIGSIAAESRRVIEAARAGRSRAEDVSGATFTITNLGMFDIDTFTPIVNLPQCAVLGLGRILARPVVIDDITETVAVRRMLSLSLTFDHRLVDGAPAARFLRRIKQFVEHPTLWLFR
jgi:pyruvate dehydrogenase E2 component (dihydrolipoamide acetyltransferase)